MNWVWRINQEKKVQDSFPQTVYITLSKQIKTFSCPLYFLWPLSWTLKKHKRKERISCNLMKDLKITDSSPTLFPFFLSSEPGESDRALWECSLAPRRRTAVNGHWANARQHQGADMITQSNMSWFLESSFCTRDLKCLQRNINQHIVLPQAVPLSIDKHRQLMASVLADQRLTELQQRGGAWLAGLTNSTTGLAQKSPDCR